MGQRIHTCLLLIGLAGLSWLGMMAVHEAGHVGAAWLTGGTIERVVFHPLAFSRTDVYPNPHPLIVVWAGPTVGVGLPVIAAGLLWGHRRPGWAMAVFHAGFCLIANGAYIGAGVVDPVGDAMDMIRLGSPRWLLLVFGLGSVMAGIWCWHKVSPALGVGRGARPVRASQAYALFAVAIVVFVLGCVLAG
ncbi:MAG: hypothetical protein IT443_01225 [Phycisphaeraceae bacterium]|nr:hypothetical protein [Phycisphaeraceae bacterium]